MTPPKKGFFDTTLSKQEVELLNYIYTKAEDFWDDETDKEFRETFAQKVATMVSEDLELPITRGWYKFGLCTLMRSNNDPSEARFPNNMGQKEEIDNTIEEKGRKLDPNKNSIAWRHIQYEAYDKEDYQVMLEIDRNIEDIDNEEIRKEIVSNLRKLKEIYPEEGYVAEKTREEVLFFCDITIDLLNNLEDQNKEVEIHINDAYDDLKGLISKAYMYETVKGPEKKSVRSDISKRIKFEKKEVRDSLKVLKGDYDNLRDKIQEDIRSAKRKRRNEVSQ